MATAAETQRLELHGSPEHEEEDELAQLEREIGLPSDDGASTTSSTLPLRSQYAQTRQELAAALANRFVHSRTYIFLYLGMAALSLTTVVLSLVEGCPGVAFYVLELIVNLAMIGEVAIRLVAFGRKFWKSIYNIIDILLTLLCALTLLLLLFSSFSRGCSRTSTSEELIDTLLLVARNIIQFVRLANVLRKSGRSIFDRPRPIDLSKARGYADIDLFDEDAALAEEEPEAAAPLVPQHSARPGVLFDANGHENGAWQGQGSAVSAVGQDRMGAPERGKVFGTDDAEEQWAHL